jgi:hypothetical protein
MTTRPGPLAAESRSRTASSLGKPEDRYLASTIGHAGVCSGYIHDAALRETPDLCLLLHDRAFLTESQNPMISRST